MSPLSIWTLEAKVNGRWKLLAALYDYPNADGWHHACWIWQELIYHSRLCWDITEDMVLTADNWAHGWEFKWDRDQWRFRRDGVDQSKDTLYDAYHWFKYDSQESPTDIDMEFYDE